MASVSSEDGLEEMSERFESYSLSADVSESESSSSGSFSNRHFDSASTFLTSSSLVEPDFDDSSGSSEEVPIMLPVVGGRHVVVSVKDTEKIPDSDLSGLCSVHCHVVFLLINGNGLCVPCFGTF